MRELTEKTEHTVQHRLT